MRRFNFLLPAVAVIIMAAAVIFAGCRPGNTPSDTQGETSGGGSIQSESEAEGKTEPPIKTPNENGTAAETESEAEPVSEAPPESETAAQIKPETQKETEITPAEPTSPASRLSSNYINMLTGLPASKDIYYKRPIAIMINNIKISLPQIGISQADVIYECQVEGGLTRLMVLSTDYDKLTEIGSVRSSREYYLDFAANHDAIYVHAGGSSEAYNQIQRRRVNNIDGVNMALPAGTFYRDEWRKVNMGYEHSLMTDGQKIAAAIKNKKYRTTISDTFTSPFNFYPYSSCAQPIDGGGEAKHVIITYTTSHFPQFIYNSSTGLYKRYQYNGVPHVDGANDEQLAFTNVLILAMPHTYSGDSYGHIDVNTAGSGKGYYIFGGKYKQISWSKKSADTPVILTNTDGTPLMMNCGKTFVNIVSESVWKTIILNYKKQ